MTIINEKKFDISLNDINSILENFKPSIFRILPNWDSINTETIKKSNLKYEVLISRIDSFFFNSFDCQQAAISIPLQINFGIVRSNVMYPPLSITDSSSPYIINFGFSLFRLRELKTIIIENKLEGIVPLSDFKKYLSNSDYNDLILYFSHNRLQNALIHEITHWLDDFHHNEAVRKSIVIQKFNNKIEVNAQIHVIAMLKLRNESQWDNLTIFDVLLKDQSLKDTYRKLSEIDKKEAIKWLKSLMKRLYREKLLGKRMNFIPKNDMKLMEDFSHDNVFNEKYYNIEKYL